VNAVTCDHCRQWIHDRIDGRLSEDDARRLNAHLVGCSDCRAFDRQMIAVIDGLNALQALSTRECDEIASGVSIRADAASTIGVTRNRARLVRLAAALALMVMGGLVSHRMLRLSTAPSRPIVDAGALSASDGPTVVLNGRTAERFIPVVRKTSDPTVHVVWLHAVESPGERNGDTSMRISPAAGTLPFASAGLHPRISRMDTDGARMRYSRTAARESSDPVGTSLCSSVKSVGQFLRRMEMTARDS
jgi:hypothetical protein